MRDAYAPQTRGSRLEESLRAFFEGRGFTAQMCEDFACEME
jgi:hypothetical protein